MATSPSGTGQQAQTDSYSVGGKSGTARKLVGRSYGDGKYRSWFVGIAPISNPKLVIVVIIDEPRWKNGYPKYFGKAINALNYSKVAIYIDGQEVDLGKHAPTDFILELDMHTGVLHRQFTLFGVQFRISKFLSVAQKERFVAGVIAAITPTG